MRAIVCVRWQCTACQSFHLNDEAAETCCVCNQPDCGSEVMSWSVGMCVAHASEAADAREARRIAAMTAVEDNDGPVME